MDRTTNIRIEINPDLPEDELVIQCRQMTDAAAQLERAVAVALSAPPSPVFFKNDTEYFFPLTDVLFFENEDDKVYAHTANDVFSTRLRLYEWEQLLPFAFIRASKSAIVNLTQIHSISRNLSAASLAEFRGSHKSVYISRFYYKALRARLDAVRSQS